MSLLDDLSQSSIGDLLGQYGPSLLTQPQMPQTTNASVAPPDAAALAAPMNANISVMPSGQNYPQMGEATLAQQLAQRAPTHPGGLQGFFSKALDALVPIPEAYKQMMSPADVKRLQMQGLQQIGAGLTGAYTGPGQRKDFGVDLGMGLNASRANTSTALDPLQQMLQTQGMGVGVQGAVMRQQAMQALAQLPAPPQGADPSAMLDYHARRMAIENSMGLAPEAQADARAMSVYQRMIDAAKPGVKAGQEPKMASTGEAETQFDPINHPTTPYLKPGADPSKPGSWVASLPKGMTEDQKAKISQDRTDRYVQQFSTDKEVTTAKQSADVAQQAREALAQARAGNTQQTALLPVLLARLVHQGGVGRVGLIQGVKVVDPSLMGRLQAALAKATTGLLPKDQLDEISQAIEGSDKVNRKIYESRYNKVKPLLGEDAWRISSPDDIWGEQTTQTGGLVGKPRF
jgi:hypothetical protein